MSLPIFLFSEIPKKKRKGPYNSQKSYEWRIRYGRSTILFAETCRVNSSWKRGFFLSHRLWSLLRAVPFRRQIEEEKEREKRRVKNRKKDKKYMKNEKNKQTNIKKLKIKEKTWPSFTASVSVTCSALISQDTASEATKVLGYVLRIWRWGPISSGGRMESSARDGGSVSGPEWGKAVSLEGGEREEGSGQGSWSGWDGRSASSRKLSSLFLLVFFHLHTLFLPFILTTISASCSFVIFFPSES